MAMVSSPVMFGGTREIPMCMGYTRGGESYYLEPSLTRHIFNHDDRWEREGYSVDLDRGETCVFTVDMAMFHGVSKNQITSVHKYDWRLSVAAGAGCGGRFEEGKDRHRDRCDGGCATGRRRDVDG